MTEQIVHEWLVDYGALSPVEVHSFASSLEHNQDLVAALYTVLEERNKYQDLIPPVCSQLFVFYRSREVELQRFTLQFLPTLIFVYLNCVAHGDKKSCRSVETLLMGLYNLEVVDENKEPKVISFRLPSLAQSSIYHEAKIGLGTATPGSHESAPQRDIRFPSHTDTWRSQDLNTSTLKPMSLAPASLTESALRRLEECNTKLVNWGPLPQVENLNAQNRLKVMTALLFVYNRQLSLLHKSALMALCKVSSKLVTQGFNKPGHHQRSSYGSDASFVPRLLPRIPVSSQFLLEFVHAVYYAMFNEFGYLATQALEDIYTRGCYESYAEVVLVTSAIRNSLRVNPSGQPSDGPMGISVALSPATTTVTTVSKSMITNASFRTKKLPDDIPIQVSKEDGGGDGKSLMAITEEQEESPATERLTPRGSSLRGSGSSTPAIKGLPKLPTFPGLGKKAKDKEAKSTTKNGATPDKKDGDPKKVEKIKDGSKVLTSRGSVLSVVFNGDATDGESSAGSSRKKGPVETSNGPFSLEANTNGSMNSTASLEMEKMSIGSDSLTTNSNVGGQGDSQLQFTGESMLPESDKTEMPLIIKKMDGDRLSMQVSSV